MICGRSVTLVKLQRIADELRHNAVKPLRITTQSQAEEFTKADKERGIIHEWKIGEKYYVLIGLMDRRKKGTKPC
jgi:hypothetical protein